VTDPNPSRLAGVEQPGARYAGRPVLPITANKLVLLLDGTLDRVCGPDEAVGYEQFEKDNRVMADLGPG
jgi:hypothetical protein